MLNRLKRNISLITMMSMPGLFLTACNGSPGTEDRQVRGNGNSDTQASAARAPTPNSNMGMSNMDMSKPASRDRNNVPTSPAKDQIVIENFSFKPATVTVKAGTTVTWVNRDNEPHTVSDSDKRFKSGAMDTDGQFSYTFAATGTYNYFCALHPRMTGQIIVR
jgi:plastocyanin